MKNVIAITKIITVLLVVLTYSQVDAQVTEDLELTISSSEFDAETIFHLNNINGELRAEGYDGEEILVTGTKRIKNSGKWEIDEFYLDRLDSKGHIHVFARHPGMEVDVNGGSFSYESTNDEIWEGDQVEFEFNLKVLVPHYLLAEIATINGGKVEVEGMTNGVKANNINGDVEVRNISGPLEARTINGNVLAVFSEVSSNNTELHTINGNIEVIAPRNFSALVTFKSLHGDLYTDFDKVEYVASRSKKKKDGKDRFSIGVSDAIQFGEGGPEMRLRLLNGNAYIKQKKS